MLIKQLPINTVGRDFVCGDIHGSFSCVERFLKEINFDRTSDRFICAGDLIDRGPENEKCLELLYEPWFHSVYGNHEHMMVDFFEDVKVGHVRPGSRSWLWAHNGGYWGVKYAQEMSDMAAFVKGAADTMMQLPLVITVEMPDNKRFHVLHAELAGAGLTDEGIKSWESLRTYATFQSEDGDAIIWGRWKFYRFYKLVLDDRNIGKIKREIKMTAKNVINDFNPELSHIYSGHTPVRTPIQFYGQTDLDTMAYDSYPVQTAYGPTTPPAWCGLTVTEPRTGKFWFINDREFKETQPLIFNEGV